MSAVEHIPADLRQLDAYLRERESAYDLKEGTSARIVWNSETEAEKTDYSIVYLHGFRASHPEGDPVHRKIAESFGYNLFLSRLEEHGVNAKYPLLDLTEDKLLHSARFAYEIGRRIGNKVIVMGTSTGGSLALWLAADNNIKKNISALILYSPLIRFFGLKEKALMNSLSRNVLHFIPGKKHLVRTKGTTYAEDRIWNKEYALQGALALGSFVEHFMHRELFSRVKCPVFAGHYYKNKDEQDQVVSVPAIKNMVTWLGTRTQFVISENFPEAKNHVICSSLLSKSVPEVIHSTKLFLKDIVSHKASEND